MILRRVETMFRGKSRWYKKELSAAGVVEMVLIILVIISLIVIFKAQLTNLLNSLFGQIQDAAGGL